MNDVFIREMLPEEAKEVQKVGRRAFTWFEGLWVPKPKQALVAVKDDKIAGAIIYKYIKAGGRTTGYYDYGFVDPAYHNQGIGNTLYKGAADYLWEQGCDSLSAAVKDDNVGSWGLLLKNGFKRISIPELIRQFGFMGAAKHYLFSPYCVGIGMDYYVASKNKDFEEKGGTMKQISSYLLANLLLSFFLLFQTSRHIISFLAAYMSLLVLVMAASWLGTRSSKRTWEYRLNNGGAVISALVNLGGVFPMVGNWYPDRYENTDEFRRDMGLAALPEWMLLVAVTVFSSLFPPELLYTRYLSQISAVFLIYRLIPVYPFESFGGRRVYDWNKLLYLGMAVITIVVLIISNL